MNEIDKLLNELRTYEQRSLERLVQCRSFQRYALLRPDIMKYTLSALKRYVPLSPEENTIRIALGITLEDWAQYSHKS